MRRPKPIPKPYRKSIKRCFVQLHRHVSTCRNSGPMKIELVRKSAGAVVECVECGRTEFVSEQLIAAEQAQLLHTLEF